MWSGSFGGSANPGRGRCTAVPQEAGARSRCRYFTRNSSTARGCRHRTRSIFVRTRWSTCMRTRTHSTRPASGSRCQPRWCTTARAGGSHDGGCPPLRTGAGDEGAVPESSCDIWQAVYGPVGADGYPAHDHEPRTGTIDRKVAEYWKEHYDLVHFMQENWKPLGPKLVGNCTSRRASRTLFTWIGRCDWRRNSWRAPRKKGQGPYYAGSIEFSASMGHGAAAGGLPPEMANRNIHERVMGSMLEWMLKSAPAGADLKSWR